jgi:hypothetical protein
MVVVGLLSMAYSRELVVLAVSWEVAGLGLWLGAGERRRAAAIHAPGLVLLTVALLGLAAPFAPPEGGAAREWAVPVVVAFGLVVLMRAGCRPFDRWAREVDGSRAELVGLYGLAAPYLLARALVGGQWDALGRGGCG